MNRNLILVAIALITWGVGEGMFFYFQPVYLEQLGADPLRIGAILGGYGAMMVLTHIPAGYLSDRLGRRPLMWLAWLMGLAAAWVMALASGLPVFVVGMLAYAMTGFVAVPMNSYITAARGRWPLGRALMMLSASFNLGMVIGPLLGGLIAERYGLRQTFLVAAIIFIFSTVVILLIQAQPVEAAPSQTRRFSFLVNGHYQVYLAAVFLAVFATYLPQPLSQNFLLNERGLSLGLIGALTALPGLGVAALNLALGFVNERLGFLLAQAAVGIFALLLWQTESLPLLALGYFLLGGYKTTRSLAIAQARVLVQSNNMGLAYGVTETAGASATVLAPLLAGYLYTRNPVWVYSFSAALILISIAAGLRFSPKPSEAPVSGPSSQILEEHL